MTNILNRLEEAVLKNDGQKTDISFLDDEMIEKIAKELVRKGFRSNPPTYLVKPINTVEGIENSFDNVYHWITTEHCPLKPVADEPKIIELIKLTSGLSTEASLKEIDELGYEPAPVNYLLGLGVQYPDVHKKYKPIISLDENNLFERDDEEQCFLCLDLCLGAKDLRGLTMISDADNGEEGGSEEEYWFAVIRKHSLKCKL